MLAVNLVFKLNQSGKRGALCKLSRLAWARPSLRGRPRASPPVPPAVERVAPQHGDARLGAPKLSAGSLHLIMGPMFAGKTSELLRRVQAAEASNKRVAIVNSIKDTRYGENMCASHNGERRKAIAVQRLRDILDSNHPASALISLNDIDVIAIDESQFFPDLHEFCLEMVEVHGKSVIAAGLNGDFRRNLFGDLVNLVPFADHVELLTARCAFCEQQALFTLRVVANDSQHLVGGAEAYSPVCREHYLKLHNCRSEVLDDV